MIPVACNCPRICSFARQSTICILDDSLEGELIANLIIDGGFFNVSLFKHDCSSIGISSRWLEAMRACSNRSGFVEVEVIEPDILDFEEVVLRRNDSMRT
jgi:hypothetical protein